MTHDDAIKILNRAVAVYGADMQIDKLIEEMSELTKALLKYRYTVGVERLARADHVSEELADVLIVLQQMLLIFRGVSDWEEKKLERLAERLGMRQTPAGEADQDD